MKARFALATILALIAAGSAEAAIPSGEATALVSPAKEATIDKARVSPAQPVIVEEITAGQSRHADS